MIEVLGRLIDLGVKVLEVAIAGGLLLALIKIALGKAEGYKQLFGVLLAVLVLTLWRTGELAVVMAELGNQLLHGKQGPSLGLGG